MKAGWALYFNPFNIHLSYRPSSKNTKVDALSRIHSPDLSSEQSALILPKTCVVGAVIWEVKEQVRQGLGEVDVVADCPPNRLFVIPRLHFTVIHWAHVSPFSSHPGIKRTLFVIQQRFWWDSRWLKMWQNMPEYVTVSACSKGSNRASYILTSLRSLPVPSHPWYHISLDFVTGLPVSNGKPPF